MPSARDWRQQSRCPSWYAAELGVVPGLEELGYHDAYRA
jgi:hypothetical protein